MLKPLVQQALFCVGRRGSIQSPNVTIAVTRRSRASRGSLIQIDVFLYWGKMNLESYKRKRKIEHFSYYRLYLMGQNPTFFTFSTCFWCPLDTVELLTPQTFTHVKYWRVWPGICKRVLQGTILVPLLFYSIYSIVTVILTWILASWYPVC